MSEPPQLPIFPTDFEQVRGGEHRFRVARSRAGQWWWIDPQGCPQVVCGMHGLDSSIGAHAADRQVAGWGINLLLPPFAEGVRQSQVPHVLELELRRAGGRLIREEGVLLPDVFDPAWGEAVEQIFNAVVPSVHLAGWMGDRELRWGGVAASSEACRRPGILQVCLGLDPAYRAYHSAWEFVLARHGGELTQIARAWGIELGSRGAARQFTRDEVVLDSPVYQEDSAAFTQEFGQRYFATIRQAAQKVNADCLLFGPPLTAVTPDTVRQIASAQTDVVLMTKPGLVAGSGPQLLVEVNWREIPRAPDHIRGESELEAMIRAGREALGTVLRQPDMLGYGWSPFRQGDLASDDPIDVGLLDENNRINAVYALPLTALNQAANGIRARAAPATATEPRPS